MQLIPGPAATSTTAPAPPALEPVPPAPLLTVAPITTLTGGDPASFCALFGDTRKLLYGWALGASTEPSSESGQDDLAFAPALARHLPPYMAAAPTELAARARPVLERAQAGVAALTAVGLDDDAVSQLADLADEKLAVTSGLDTTGVEADLATALIDRVGAARLTGAAQAFSRDHPQAPDLFDLGDVPAAVAQSSGCLTLPG